MRRGARRHGRGTASCACLSPPRLPPAPARSLAAYDARGGYGGELRTPSLLFYASACCRCRRGSPSDGTSCTARHVHGLPSQQHSAHALPGPLLVFTQAMTMAARATVAPMAAASTTTGGLGCPVFLCLFAARLLGLRCCKGGAGLLLCRHSLQLSRHLDASPAAVLPPPCPLCRGYGADRRGGADHRGGAGPYDRR